MTGASEDMQRSKEEAKKGSGPSNYKQPRGPSTVILTVAADVVTTSGHILILKVPQRDRNEQDDSLTILIYSQYQTKRKSQGKGPLETLLSSQNKG